MSTSTMCFNGYVSKAQIRKAIAQASSGLPTLQGWLDSVAAIDPSVKVAVEGIYTGLDGRANMEYDSKSNIVVGWHSGRVEFGYLS